MVNNVLTYRKWYKLNESESKSLTIDEVKKILESLGDYGRDTYGYLENIDEVDVTNTKILILDMGNIDGPDYQIEFEFKMFHSSGDEFDDLINIVSDEEYNLTKVALSYREKRVPYLNYKGEDLDIEYDLDQLTELMDDILLNPEWISSGLAEEFGEVANYLGTIIDGEYYVDATYDKPIPTTETELIEVFKNYPMLNNTIKFPSVESEVESTEHWKV